jgi:predicted secreted protein
MATHHGLEGVVKVSTATVAEVRSFEIEVQQDTVDDSVMGDSWHSHLTGLKSWSANVECLWDETDTQGQVALTIGASVSLTLGPEGGSSGDTIYSGTATVKSIGVAVPHDGVVTRRIAFEGNGALSIGTVGA